MSIQAFLVAQSVKNLPVMQEAWVQSLGQDDLLEKEMATHFWILVWEVPWTEDPGRLQSTGTQRVRHNLVTKPPYVNSGIFYSDTPIMYLNNPYHVSQQKIEYCFWLAFKNLIILLSFLLALPFLNPTGFRLLCFHFHLFLCIFWFLFKFLLWFLGYSEVCCLASICLYS